MSDKCCPSPGPSGSAQTVAAGGISRGVSLEQSAEGLQDLRRFLSARGCRSRPRWTWPAGNSRRPRATVSSSNPKISTSCRSPPWPCCKLSTSVHNEGTPHCPERRVPTRIRINLATASVKSARWRQSRHGDEPANDVGRVHCVNLGGADGGNDGLNQSPAGCGAVRRSVLELQSAARSIRPCRERTVG